MALQGSIESFAVVDVLGLLEASAKTGRLLVSGDRGTASLWVLDGLIVGGSPTSGGPTALMIDATILEVLRFDSGSFVFESEVPCDDPAPGVSIADAVERAGTSLAELATLSERIPSSDSAVSLAATLGAESVELDREAWAAIATIGEGTSVGEMGRRLQLDEVAVFRCVSGLLDLGVVELGAVVVDDRAISRVFDDDGWVPPGLVTDRNPEDLFGDSAFSAPAFSDHVHDARTILDQAPVVSAAGSVGTAAFGGAVRAESAVPEGLDLLFGDFDPFAAPAAPPDSSVEPLDGSDPSTPDPGAAGTELTVTATVDDEDLARQMAVLSPRAAQAVAAAVQESKLPVGVDSADLEPEGREHVLRFLDSVQ